VAYKSIAESLDTFNYPSVAEFHQSQSDKLNNAINAFGEALNTFTIKKYPLDYAMAQNNLGTIYSLLASIDESPDEDVQKAIDAYEAALKVYRPEVDAALNKKVKANLVKLKQRFNKE